MTIARLADAVRTGDIATVRAMLGARPEIVNMDMAANNEHRALHYAVLNRAPEMVRVLMEHGADARKGAHLEPRSRVRERVARRPRSIRRLFRSGAEARSRGSDRASAA